ncbi:hypothetical protein ACFLSZ_02330 [Candidatus Bipolaricaulota bacterium]
MNTRRLAACANIVVCLLIGWGVVFVDSGVTLAQNERSRYEGDCVFCWVDGSEPDMPVWSEGRSGFIHQANDSREQMVMNQTFTVRTGETQTFTDKVIWVRPSHRGEIEIYGTLILQNCLLLWDQSEHQQVRLHVKDGGSLRATNCYSFSANSYWVNWEFESGASIHFDRFVGDPWTSIWGSVEYESTNYSTVSMTLQNATRGSDVRISDAHHLWFEIFPPLYRSVDIAFAARRQWTDWTIADMWPDTLVQVEDSYVYERDISLSRGNHVTVRDTTDGFSMGWAIYKNTPGFVECELSGLGTPGSESGTYYANKTWNLPGIDSSLTLINSKLERAWPTTWGSVHLIVRDSNLADPRVWGGPATYEIYDSTIDHAAAYSGGRMYLENCMIRFDIEVKDSDSAVHGYNLRGPGVGPTFDVLEVDGGVYIDLDSEGAPW